MKVTNICNILLTTMFMSLFCACDHKPLYIRGEETEQDMALSPVYIDFDWSELEEGESIPKGMTVFAYPAGKSDYKKYDIPTSYEGMVELPVGDVMLVYVNNDNNNVYTEKYTSALTNQLVLSNNLARLDMLYGGSCQKVIPEQSEEPIHIVLTPECVCKHIRLTFCNLNATCQEARFNRASVTGLTNIITAHNWQVSDEAESVLMRQNLTRNETTLTGSLRCLGIMPNAYTHKVLLSSYNPKGGVTVYRFYVTEKVKSQASQHVIELELDLADGEELDQWDPDYRDIADGDGKGGFQTDIDDFEEEVIDTDMK